MDALFEKSNINGMVLSNRFVRSATWAGMATDEGTCTPQLIHLLSDLAVGEVGMIITGHAYVRQDGQHSPWQLGIHQDAVIPGLQDIDPGPGEEWVWKCDPNRGCPGEPGLPVPEEDNPQVVDGLIKRLGFPGFDTFFDQAGGDLIRSAGITDEPEPVDDVRADRGRCFAHSPSPGNRR